MARKVIFGGRFYKFSLVDLEWERTGNEAKDFLSLVRQVVYIMLGFQGIVAREFVSLNGFFILTVCYSHEFNTKMVVEHLRMKKFLEVSFIDLMSLEPLDGKHRPLRLHENIQDVKMWEYHYGPDSLPLFHQIRALTRQINFQKMVREFKGVWGKDMIREENSQRQIYEHADVPLSTWKNYHLFLQNLAEKVKQIRVDFKTKQFQMKAKFYSKFEGFTDFGQVLKEMAMKSTQDDYFHLNNIERFLRSDKKSKWRLKQDLPERDQQLVDFIIEFIGKKTGRKPDGKTTVSKSSLAKKQRMKKMPLKEVNVLKGDTKWFDKKNEAFLKELSMEYYNAMKESFAGTEGLTNKWVIWGQTPIGGHSDFVYPRNKRRRRVKQFLTLMWKKYKNTPKNTLFFDEYEKLRAMDFQLNKIIQMGDLGSFFKAKITQCW